MMIKGWLMEKASKLLSCKQWYCTLFKNKLSFFANEQSLYPNEIIRLDQIKHVHKIKCEPNPGFTLELKDNKEKFLFCNSQQEIERWIGALKPKHKEHPMGVDDFEILRLIGEGYSGKVYLSRCKINQKLYAIKAIDKYKLNSQAKASQVLSELNILMKAKHQFITHLYYAFQDCEKCYLVLEYVAGGDLRFHLENNDTFSQKQIKLWLAEIVIALKTLHKIGVIYRDLKPENILIDVKGHIKLADFGLSKQQDANDSSFCGTVEYLSPEMLNGEEQTFSIDWWGLGILAHRLITGRLPFSCFNRRKLFEKIRYEKPNIPKTVDEVTASFINGLLEKDPKKRLGPNITEHPYFAGIDWKKVAKMQTTPEFSPYVPNDDSVINFSENYTSETVPSSLSSNSDESVLDIQSFSYVDCSIPRVISFENYSEAQTKEGLCAN
ncbi:AGC family protein kinase [Histomonas meleagridis]|uniref:AGC family protein kinase n=1 Tax=Histomonas meleagridis TaxID=135588 RepID=UPI00355A23D9|nr:AGC family protein kinase [Histomonas meleagridis]KAH0798791.1 AGC family protein kinase [Histomonas meleagridis]